MKKIFQNAYLKNFFLIYFLEIITFLLYGQENLKIHKNWMLLRHKILFLLNIFQ